MFSFFFVTVAEGAEGPSSEFEVRGRELAELDEGRSQEAMDNSLHNHTKRGRVQLSSLRGRGSLVFEGVLYLSARSNQGNTVGLLSTTQNYPP